MIVATPFKGFAGCAQALSDYDLRPGLAGIERPTLLLAGSKDAVLAGIRAIHAAVPGARLVELDAGHLSNLEQPGALCCRCSGFSERGVRRHFSLQNSGE